MTVGDLIKKLQTIPPDLIICRPGYEGGFKEVKEAVTVLLAVNVNSEWYFKIDTPKGCVNNGLIWLLNLQYGEDFLKKHRYKFIKLKDQMERLGLSVTKIKEI